MDSFMQWHFEFSVKTIYFLAKRSYDIEVDDFVEV